MDSIVLDIRNKIRETDKGILIEIGEYQVWFSKKFTNINNKTKKITLQIFKDGYYPLDKISIKNHNEKLTGKYILDYVKNIPDIKIDEIINKDKLEPFKFYEEYNGIYLLKNNKKQDCFKYSIIWQDYNSFKINTTYKHNDLSKNYMVMPIQDITTHNNKIFYLQKEINNDL